MRSILAIETSTTTARIAFARGDEIVFEKTYLSERSHNARIFEPLRDALTFGRPDALAIGTGPGSYTGIRIGISAALGIGLVQGIPTLGLPSLCALVDPEERTLHSFLAIGDARRGQVWVARVEEGDLVEAPSAMDAGAARERAEAHEGMLLTVDAVSPLEGIDPVLARPSAAMLARRIALLEQPAFEALAAIPPAPIYLAAPFVTQPRKIGK